MQPKKPWTTAEDLTILHIDAANEIRQSNTDQEEEHRLLLRPF